jgi:hypothetical protein
VTCHRSPLRPAQSQPVASVVGRHLQALGLECRPLERRPAQTARPCAGARC